MTRQSRRELASFWRRYCNCFLACSWISGLLAGQFLFLRADASVYVVMRSAFYRPVSIVGLFFTTVIPFVVSAFAVSFSKPWLLVPLCFARSLLFSYIVLGMAMSYGASGWLIRWLLLFSQCVAVSLEYWYWRHCVSGERGLDFPVFLFLISLVFLIVSLDYCLMMPFGAHFLD